MANQQTFMIFFQAYTNIFNKNKIIPQILHITRTAMRCNNRDDLLRLSFTLKISNFQRPIYNLVEEL